MAKKKTETAQEFAQDTENLEQESEILTEEDAAVENASEEAKSFAFDAEADRNDDKTRAKPDEAALRYLRLQADFDNFKKRNAATASKMYNEGLEEALSAMLPTLDYLDMAIAAQKDESQRKGVELVKKTMLDVFAKYEVEQIEALGKDFDPNVHEAMLNRDDPDNAGKVVEVLKAGYRRGDKVLRHAMVVVGQ